MTLRNILSTLLLICTPTIIYAQNSVCTIDGTFSNTKLRNKTEIQKVYLNQLNEQEQFVVVDSAQVNNGSFSIRYSLPSGNQTNIYILTGFDNGNIPFFVEPGTVKLHIDASYPAVTKISGTPTNDIFSEYGKIWQWAIQIQRDSLQELSKKKADSWFDTKESGIIRGRIGAEVKVKSHLKRMRFLLEHSDSPLSPLMLRKEVMYALSNKTTTELSATFSPKLADHPYIDAYINAGLARHIGIGSELPNISLPDSDGKIWKLKDFRGKYVLLDFWASWCGPCRREIPYIIDLYNRSRSMKDKFTIISFSFDSKRKNWLDAIPSLGMNKPDWYHMSDLAGWNSAAAQILGISAIPKTYLIDPKGNVIAIDLRGEHLVQKVMELIQ